MKRRYDAVWPADNSKEAKLFSPKFWWLLTIGVVLGYFIDALMHATGIVWLWRQVRWRRGSS